MVKQFSFDGIAEMARIQTHKQRSIRETFYIMPYCTLMKKIANREEWDLWKYELRYLYQFLEPEQR